MKYIFACLLAFGLPLSAFGSSWIRIHAANTRHPESGFTLDVIPETAGYRIIQQSNKDFKEEVSAERFFPFGFSYLEPKLGFYPTSFELLVPHHQCHLNSVGEIFICGNFRLGRYSKKQLPPAILWPELKFWEKTQSNKMVLGQVGFSLGTHSDAPLETLMEFDTVSGHGGGLIQTLYDEHVVTRVSTLTPSKSQIPKITRPVRQPAQSSPVPKIKPPSKRPKSAETRNELR